MKHDKPNIAVIGGPVYSTVGEMILSNYIDVLQPLSNEIYVITGRLSNRASSKVHIISMRSWRSDEPLSIKMLKYWPVQLQASFHLLRLARKIDIVIFQLGTRGYVIPLLTAKLLSKKTISIFTGLQSARAKTLYGRWLFGLGGVLFPPIFRLLEKINLFLADQIAVQHSSGIDSLGLGKYMSKIAISGAKYIDIDSFKIIRKIEDRRNVVGYVGRLSPEKGVMNFARAIPLVLKERQDIEFLIGGDGPLFNQLKETLADNNLHPKVRLTGWIPDDKFVDYLNELKLLVLPSLSGSEGLPSIITESMACGAICLATPSGCIPGLIKDSETGFILEDNTPECIAKNILRALEHPKLIEISQHARRLIEEEYSYEAIMEQCRNALEELMKGQEAKV